MYTKNNYGLQINIIIYDDSKFYISMLIMIRNMVQYVYREYGSEEFDNNRLYL